MIDDRIAKLDKYFKSYNIAEGVVYALAKFPPKWTVPDEIEQLKVKTAKDGESGGYFFFSSIEDGYEVVFDGIQYVVELNVAIEEKTVLLVKMANELRDIFASEPIEKLKMLRFTFEHPKKSKTKKSIPKKETPVEMPIEEKIEDKNNTSTGQVEEDDLLSFVDKVSIEENNKRKKKIKK